MNFQQTEEVLLLLEGSDRVRCKLLKKCSDETPILMAQKYAESITNNQKNKFQEEFDKSMKKMFDATRILNSEKYDSDYLSGKAE